MVGEEQKILAMSDTMSQEQSLYLSLASLRRRNVERHLDGLQNLITLADYKVALAGTLTEIIDVNSLDCAILQIFEVFIALFYRFQ